MRLTYFQFSSVLYILCRALRGGAAAQLHTVNAEKWRSNSMFIHRLPASELRSGAGESTPHIAECSRQSPYFACVRAALACFARCTRDM